MKRTAAAKTLDTAKAAAAPQATGFNGALVVHADANHGFSVPIPQSMVAKVQIVDVDLVLVEKDGRRIILQGGALDAFAYPESHVAFSDAAPTLSSLTTEVGEVQVDEQPFTAVSSPQSQDANADSDKTADADQAAKPIPPATPQPPPDSGIGAGVFVPNFFVSNIIYASPPAHQSPASPSFNDTTEVTAQLEAKVGTSLVNGVLTGAYGAAGADTNPSAVAQIAPQVIANGAPNLTILANALAGQDFIKVLHISFTGAGTITSLSLSGLGAGFSIPGATPSASGVYTLNAASYASAQGPDQFDVPIEYGLFTPSAASPTHESFQVSLSLVSTGTTSATYTNSLTFVVVDATTAANITGATTGSNVLVFPAEGIGYQITAFGADTVTGGQNNDTIYASGGANVLDGAAGINTLDYSANAGSETINAASGIAIGPSGVDTISHFQILIGSQGSDLIIGSSTTVSEASGGSGFDTFESGGGGSVGDLETIAGGSSGGNTLSYADATAPVQVNLQTGLATGFGEQTISNIEYLIGSAYNDTLTGAASTLALSSGGPSSNTTFDPGGGGTATVLESITGSVAGVNTVTYANSPDAVVVNLTTGLATGYGDQSLSNIEIVVGSNYNDALTGSLTTEALIGGSGADTFDGGGGGTVAAPESIFGGTGGANTLTFVNAPGGVVVDLNAGLAYGSTVSGQGYGYETISNIQYVIGSPYSDSLTGSVATRELSGGTGGNDTFDGGGGGSAAAPESIVGSAAGVNTLTFAAAPEGVTVNLSPSGGRDGYETGDGVLDIQNIQDVVGGAYSDSLRGAATTRVLNGGAGGDDTFDGGGGGTAATPESIIGGLGGTNTLTFAADPYGGVAANLGTGVISANAYGYEKVSNIQVVIGSPQGNDSLTGSLSTLELEAGSTTANDTFDGGGGGTAAAPETITGGVDGVSNTLTFANDTLGSVDVNLASGVINAGGKAGYGYLDVSGIQHLIGSAGGGDTLMGGPGVTYISSPSTIAGDTFDGGGGGTASAPVYLVGQAAVQNTLTFADDTHAGAAGGVTVNLAPSGALYGQVTGAYGVESLSNITRIIGTAAGNDDLIGGPTGADLIAGGGQTTLQAGGGSTTLMGGAGADSLIAATGLDLILPGGGAETIVGTQSPGVSNADTLSFVGSAGGVDINLALGAGSGDGNLSIRNVITTLIGSAFNDNLVGTTTTQEIAAGGPQSDDTFDGGGGGSITAPETIIGSAHGVNTLTFAADSVAAVNADLATGVVDGSGPAGYGYYQVSNIQALVGSAAGGDTLQGDSSTTIINGSAAATADTFDGGGGGSQTLPEIITGAANLANTLEFSQDSAYGAAGGVYVNLESGIVHSQVYGYEEISNIYQVLGSAEGNDTLIGGDAASVLIAGAGSDLLQTGVGGGVIEAGTGSDTIDAQTGPNDIILGGGAATINGPAATTAINADTLNFSAATGAVDVNLLTLNASGFGAVSLTGAFTGLIGSNNLGDSLVGSPSTTYISGGGGKDGVIDPGGGGSMTAPETVIGGSGGLYALSFGNDTGYAVDANLSSGSAALGGAGTVNALGAATNSGGYGYDHGSDFEVLVGSARGGDTLIGGPGVVLVSSGQATVDGLSFSDPTPAYGDTFDGGGGGTSATPESLIGSAAVVNTVTFSTDTLSGAAGGVNLNLSLDTVAGGYGRATVEGAVEALQNIHDVVGSAHGQDTLIGDGLGDLIQAGGGFTSISEIASSTNDVNTLVGGAGGGVISAASAVNLIDGGPGALNVIYGVLNDTLAFNNALSSPGTSGVNANLATGFVTLKGSGLVDTLTSGANQGAIAELIGSAGNDSLTGTTTTESIIAGAASSSDTIAPGGGGTSSLAEVIQGGSSGVNTLTYAADAVSSINAVLGAGSVAGSVTSTGYGDQSVSYVEKLIGSAKGGDFLEGSASALLLQSGSTSLGDTFDGGGGGTVAAPESIVGTPGSAINTVTAADDTVHAVTINLATGVLAATPTAGGASWGYEVLSNIQEAIGSAKGGDLLTGAATTLYLGAGSGANDTFVAGGGGTTSVKETIAGGASGAFLLNYASDTIASLNANLTSGLVTSTNSLYGVQSVSGITQLYGSAKGSDDLIGSPNVTLIRAEAGGDTIDGGGGGVAAIFETITGSGATTLSFGSDSVHSVVVNLATGSVNAGGAYASGGYGYETVSGVTALLGSAIGGDSLTGTTTTTLIAAGSGSGDTIVAGGEGSSAAPETITGSATGSTELSYASDSLGAIQANLLSGTVNTTGYGYQSVSNINELIGSGKGGDVIFGNTNTILLAASSAATTGDTFYGGGGGTLSIPETITGSSSGTNELSLTSSGASAYIDLSAETINGGTYGVEHYSAIQEIAGSSGAAGSDTFAIESSLATNGVATLIGSAANTDNLNFVADTLSSGGVSVNLSAGSVGGAVSIASISNFYTVYGSYAGADTLTSGTNTAHSYVFYVGTGADQISAGSSGTTTTVEANAGGGADTITDTGAGAVDVNLTLLPNSETVKAVAAGDTFSGATYNATVSGGGVYQITGSTVSGALNELSFASLATGAVVANLQTGSVTGSVAMTASNFDELVGSASGADHLTGGTANDTLIGGGGAGTTITAGSATNLIEPGLATESIIASAGTTNTLSFVQDTTSGSLVVNLTNLASGGSASATVHGAVDTLSGAISALTGSAVGGDTLTGYSHITSITGVGADTFDGGGATATISDTTSGSTSTLSLQSDTASSASITVNLNTGVESGYGSLTFNGSNIHDVIGSPGGSDLITVDSSADVISLGGSNATINGPASTASDTVSFALSSGAVTVNLAAGSFSGFGSGSITGEFKALIGGSGADTLTGSSYAAYVYGGTGGGDLISDPYAGSLAAPATLVGGASGGSTFTLASDGVGGVAATLPSSTATLGSGGALPTGYGSVSAGTYGDDVLSNFQNLIGSAAGGDTLVGASGALSLAAGPTINGSVGDTFDGGGGGTSGAVETITGAAGLMNTVTYANDTLSGSSGGVAVNLATGVVTGGYGYELLSNIHTVIGSASGNDSITGDASADALYLGAGLDTVAAGSGLETIYAGAGGDLIKAASGLDVLSFASDTLGGLTASLTASGGTITGYGVADTVSSAGLYGLIGSAAGGDVLDGSSSTHLITAPAAASNDTFSGGGGGTLGAPESLIGGTLGSVVSYALDTLSGASGAVNVNLLTGSETSANYGYETLTNFNDVIGSASGNDTIIANNNGDLITTGTGTVSITGGLGNDTINALLASGGVISASSSRASTAADTIELGVSFFNSISASPSTAAINPGGGNNTLVLDWQASSSSTSFSFANLTPNSTVTGGGAVQNISTIDLSGNTLASGGVAYTITPQEVLNMAPTSGTNANSLSIHLPAPGVNGYTGHDSLTISLTGTSDTVVIGAAGAEYIYSSSHTLLATVHLI